MQRTAALCERIHMQKQRAGVRLPAECIRFEESFYTQSNLRVHLLANKLHEVYRTRCGVWRTTAVLSCLRRGLEAVSRGSIPHTPG